GGAWNDVGNGDDEAGRVVRRDRERALHHVRLTAVIAHVGDVTAGRDRVHHLIQGEVDHADRAIAGVRHPELTSVRREAGDERERADGDALYPTGPAWHPNVHDLYEARGIRTHGQ